MCVMTIRGMGRLSVLAYLCFAVTGAVAQSARAPIETRSQILTPAKLAPAQATLDPATHQWVVTGELFNPVSGFYTVVAQKQIGPNNPPCPHCTPDLNFQPIASDEAPVPGVPANVYGRLSWHTLEPLEGRYDFSVIDHVLEPCASSAAKSACLPQGATFGLRIMALNPQYKSETNVTTGDDGYPIYSDSPAYLLKDAVGKAHGWLLPVDPGDATQGHYFIPDWNDKFVIDRVWALLKALGSRYDDDPRIGTIDIGLYGSWGEWHTAGLPDTRDYKWGAIPYAATNTYYNLNEQAYETNNGVPGAYQAGSAASKQAIIWAHVRAFPNKQLVMLTDDADSLCTAMRINVGNLPIGLRRDSLGSYTGWAAGFPPASECKSSEGRDLVAERWQHAPFVVEPFGNGSSPEFPCQTFETDPTTNQLAILQEVPRYHLAAIKNGAFCAGTWSALTQTEQAAVWTAGLTAGYRYWPSRIAVQVAQSVGAQSVLSVNAQWNNDGLTPTYTNWRVEFALRPSGSIKAAPWQPSSGFVSGVELRSILPGSVDSFEDKFVLPTDMAPGEYELDVRVTDRQHYLMPMQLALKDRGGDGYYSLGIVQIPDTRGGLLRCHNVSAQRYPGELDTMCEGPVANRTTFAK